MPPLKRLKAKAKANAVNRKRKLKTKTSTFDRNHGRRERSRTKTGNIDTRSMRNPFDMGVATISVESSRKMSYGDISTPWPECIDSVDPDWASLYPIPATAAAKKKSFWMSPRMALRLFEDSIILADETALGVLNIGIDKLALPGAAMEYSLRPGRRMWSVNLSACYKRISLRLKDGIIPLPNCVGEVVAIRNVLALAKAEGHLANQDEFTPLPKTRRDKNFDLVRRMCLDLDDREILKRLFSEIDEEETNECGESDSSHLYGQKRKCQEDLTEDAMFAYAADQLGLSFQFSLEVGEASTKMLNLHPGRWFVAFREEDFERGV